MIEWILTSSVLILVMIGLRAVLRKRISTKLQYLLWALVLVRLLVPFSLPSQTSVANFVPPSAVHTLGQPIAYTGYDPQDLPDQALPELTPPVSDNMPLVQPEQPDRNQVQEQLDHIKADMGTPITWENVLLVIWFAGMALMSALLIISNLRFNLRLKRSRVRITFEGSPLPVYTSALVNSPCLFGMFRPAVYLTDEVQQNSQLCGYVMAHELAHYRTGDHIWSILRSICLVLHWYNPLVWVAAVLSKRDAESWCDESAIQSLGEHTRHSYGETLIRMSCIKKDTKALLTTATTISGGKKALKDRILLIAKHPKTAVYTLVLVLVIAIIAVGCTFTGPQNETISDTKNAAESTKPVTEPSEVQEHLKPTGYPEDEIQVTLAYINGQLYVHDSTAEILDTVPQGYSYAGVVRHEDNKSVPKQEKHACHLEVGTDLYINESDDTYIYYWRYPRKESPYPRRMIRVDKGGYEWVLEEADDPTELEDLNYSKLLLNGILYVAVPNARMEQEKPDGYKYYASVESKATIAKPTEHLQSKVLPEGTEIYTGDFAMTRIYCKVLTSEGYRYMSLMPESYDVLLEQTLRQLDQTGVRSLPATYDVNDLVTYSVSDYFAWIDDNGRIFYNLNLPSIYPFSQDAIEVNKQILSTHMLDLDYVRDYHSSYYEGIAPPMSSIYFSSSLRNDVLSVVIFENTPIDMTLYEVYNFDLSTGKLMDQNAFLDKLGIPRQQFWTIAEETAKAVYIQKYSYYEPGTYEFYDQQYASTFAEENLQDAQLYWNENGTLVMVLDMMPLAGGSRYPTAVVLPIT